MKALAQRSYLLLLLLSGCVALGLQQPQTTEDKFQYAKATASAAYRTIGDLKSQGRITANDGIQYFNRVENLEKQLSEVESLVKLKDATADRKVDAILKTLLAIEAELKGRK